MIRVWILLLFCLILAHYYEKSLIVVDEINHSREETFTSSVLFFALAATLVLFAGFRTRMNDTGNYFSSFINDNRVPSGWGTIFNVDWEMGSNPFFAIFQRLLKTLFGSNPQILIFVSSLIVVCSYLLFIRKYTAHFGWSIFVLIAFYVYGFSMAAMKQSLSIAIGIWAIPCFIDRTYFKAFSILILASLFHPYVLLLGLLCFFMQDVWKKKTMLIILGTIVAVLLFTFFVDFVMDVSELFGEDYKKEYFTEGGVGIARIVSYLTIPTVSFFARKEINDINNPFINMCVNATILSGCLMTISGLGGSVMFGRVPSYFDVFTCITVSVLFTKCNFNNRNMYKVAYVCLLLVYYYTYYKKYLIGYCNGDWFADIYNHTSIFSLFGR